MDSGHWICIYYSNFVIHVYDSFNMNTLTDDCKIFINRMFPNNSNLRIVFEEVQYQINPYDCGVFAIAFTVAMIYNYCPCGLIFDISKMRDHFLSIYETNFNDVPIRKK